MERRRQPCPKKAQSVMALEPIVERGLWRGRPGVRASSVGG